MKPREAAKPSVRLFAAVPLPADLRAQLAEAGRELAAGLRGARVRPVPEANLHLTIRFFGKADLERIRDSLQGALPPPSAPRLLRVRGYAAFPTMRRARGVFAEMGGDELKRIREAGEAAARAAGLAPERRPFRPHITIARFRGPLRLDDEALGGLPRPAGAFEVERLQLLQSTLAPEGVSHEVRGEFPLVTDESSRKSASRSGPSRA